MGGPTCDSRSPILAENSSRPAFFGGRVGLLATRTPSSNSGGCSETFTMHEWPRGSKLVQILKSKRKIRLKRFAVFVLLAALNGACSASAQSPGVAEYARESRETSKKSAKAQNRMLKKAAGKQRKAMRKYAKAQRKAAKKANRRAR